MKGVARLLFDLPDVIAAAARHEELWVVEGEHAMEALFQGAGVRNVTTLSGGSKAKWLPENTAALRGASLVRVWADNDEPGYAHARKVYGALTAAGIPTKIVRSATDGKGDDAVDHLAAGFSLAQVVDVLPEPLRPPGADAGIALASDIPIRRVRWLWEPYLPLGKVGRLDGDPGRGKSMITAHLVACCVTGAPWPGAIRRRGQRLRLAYGAVMICAEDDWGDTIRPRLQAAIRRMVSDADVHAALSRIAVIKLGRDEATGEVIPLEFPRDIDRVRKRSATCERS